MFMVRVTEFTQRTCPSYFACPSTSTSISDSVVPSALASLWAATMEGVLSALSTAPK